MAKFLRISEEVEAGQFFPEKTPWPEGIVLCAGPGESLQFKVQSHGELLPVSPGDWVVTCPNEARYACSTFIFNRTHTLKEGITHG